MATAYLFEIAGGTQAMYDEAIKKLEAVGAGAPKGRTYHVAGPTDNGWRVVDVWDSQADWDAFMQGSLAAIMKEVGMPMPAISPFPAHNIIVG